MKFNAKNAVLLLLTLPLCSYTGYKKCVPCAKSDLKGKIKKLTEIEQVGRDETEKLIYLYNEQGQLTEERDSLWKKYEDESAMELALVSVIKYFYKDGLLQREEAHRGTKPDIANDRMVNYKYDEKGREISAFEYFRSAEPDARTETSYDDKDARGVKNQFNRHEQKRFVENTGQRRMEVYDKNGRVTEVWAYNADSNSYWLDEMRRYDETGNMVESRARDKRGLERSRAFQFDKEGKLTSATYELPSGLKRNVTYTYSEPDSRGNYLKIVSSGGVVTTRLIEYYE